MRNEKLKLHSFGAQYPLLLLNDEPRELTCNKNKKNKKSRSSNPLLLLLL
jgi:hypothetical protein